MSNSALATNPIAAAPFPLWVRLCGTFVAHPSDDQSYFGNPNGWLPATLPDAQSLADHLFAHEKAGGHIFVYDPLLAESAAALRTAQQFLYGFGLNAWAVDYPTPPPNVEVIEQWPQVKTTSPKDSTDEKQTTT